MAKDHARIITTIRSWMPGALLSPSAHAMLAQTLEAMGEAAPARVEEKLAALALASIRSTGDGTQQTPYSVLRVEDEYDVLLAASERSTGQRQVSDARGTFDVHTLPGGEQRWFHLLWLPGDTPES